MPPRRITTLPHKFKTLTDDTPPTIRVIYAGAVNARFPVHQVNGIWHYDEDDLPAIMAAFGLRSGCVRAAAQGQHADPREPRRGRARRLVRPINATPQHAALMGPG